VECAIAENCGDGQDITFVSRFFHLLKLGRSPIV